MHHTLSTQQNCGSSAKTTVEKDLKFPTNLQTNFQLIFVVSTVFLKLTMLKQVTNTIQNICFATFFFIILFL